MKKYIISALILFATGLQTVWAQGFRVYNSDGTVMQFSLRTDSIVFYDGIGSEQDLGLFTPANQCIVGTWYESKTDSYTFNEDGTTNHMEGATYKFFPYLESIIFYDALNIPYQIYKVHELTAERMVVSAVDSKHGSYHSNFFILSRTKPVLYVTEIMLNETSVTLQPDETKRLVATVFPEDADNPTVIWESSDETVAQVINQGNQGLVVAVGYGTCDIICRATDDSGIYAACRVTIANNKFCSLPARLTIENVQQAPVLYTACESMGEYCYITTDGQKFNFTDAQNHTSSINITAMTEYSGYYLGLSGFIVGKLTIPEMGEDFVRVVCYDRVCSNCYQEYNITKPLVLQTGGYAYCKNCQRTYDLNNIGNVTSAGPAGRALYRYRVNYIGNVLVINNG